MKAYPLVHYGDRDLAMKRRKWVLSPVRVIAWLVGFALGTLASAFVVGWEDAS